MFRKTKKVLEEPISIKKKGMPRPLRNGLISSAILLVLLVGAGVAYTWWSGRQPLSTTATVETAAPVDPVIKPSHISPDAKESAAVETLTSPVVPGSNASITVKTNPDSACTITVLYGATVSKDSGLGPKKSDAYGTISWTWTVDKSVTVGTWPVTVTCVYNTHSAVVQADLNVSEIPTT